MADTSEPSAKATPATKTAIARIPQNKPAPKKTSAQNTWYAKPMRGVIIGVSAVIAVVSLTQGVNQSVSARFASLGTNVITISPGAASTGGAQRCRNRTDANH